MIHVRLELIERHRRDAAEIKYEVLMASVSGMRKTRIMYESGLNLKQLNLYLGELMTTGALEFSPPDRRYYITNKGRAYMNAFGQYRETINLLKKAEAELAQFFPNTGSPLVAPTDRLRDPLKKQKYHF